MIYILLCLIQELDTLSVYIFSYKIYFSFLIIINNWEKFQYFFICVIHFSFYFKTKIFIKIILKIFYEPCLYKLFFYYHLHFAGNFVHFHWVNMMITTLNNIPFSHLMFFWKKTLFIIIKKLFLFYNILFYFFTFFLITFSFNLKTVKFGSKTNKWVIFPAASSLNFPITFLFIPVFIPDDCFSE